MPLFQKENVQEGELALYEILADIADAYNTQFSTLLLPKPVDIDHKRSILTLPFYEGETFDKKWSTKDGGAALHLDLSAEVPRILKDLSVIDICVVEESNRLKQLPNIRFNRAEYSDAFKRLCTQFVDFGLITQEEKNTALILLEEDFSSPIIFNNGDFYPRNLIRMAHNRMILIDWETWNSHSVAYTLDHRENVAAYFFVNMWNNEAWQKKYVQELKRVFNVHKKDFQKGIIIKAADSAVFWFKNKSQATVRSPIRLFKKALTTEYMDWLWDN